MLTIGFTNTFYTLWDVSEPFTTQVNSYTTRTKTTCTYIKNLSTDLEKAKAMLAGQEYQIDLELRGSFSFTRIIGDVKLPGVFHFGKYAGQEISKCTDLKYLQWYCNNKTEQRDLAMSVLAEHGYTELGGHVYSADELDEMRERQELEQYLNTLQQGHMFEHGARIELEIKKVGEFWFESMYGSTAVVTYATRCGKLVKYVGGSPQDVGSEFCTVAATVKHTTYDGQPETHLQRIKIK